ncbi:MAG: GDYXXLXY domain-containing protein [Flavobacteriaceae bacterium]|nr:GDYXXLXY domain-containing protein [Flavobacteriaceae bacterium]
MQIKSTQLFVIFILVAIVQVSIPVKMIYQRESVLKYGTVYKFKTQPIDPADPFRGRYVQLHFDANIYKTQETNWKNDEPIYVSFIKDGNGFAQIEDVTKEAPNNETYVLAKVTSYVKWRNELHINYGIERFYMKETKAKAAEIKYIESESDSISHAVYATVYVKAGEAVLDNVFIDDIPIGDVVE